MEPPEGERSIRVRRRGRAEGAGRKGGWRRRWMDERGQGRRREKRREG